MVIKQRRSSHIKDRGRVVFIVAGLIPLLLWIFYFAAYPLWTAIIRSFTNWTLASQEYQFTGLSNYQRLLSDPVFILALKNTLLSVVMVVPATVVISLLLAIMLNASGDRVREIMTPIYFLPSITATVVIASIWRWLYHPSYGIINYLFGLVGIAPKAFLTNPTMALPSIAVMTIWSGVGYHAVVLLAALKNVPGVYYEVAIIDGASAYKRAISITLPLIQPTILFTTIMVIISTFQIFVPINIMTQGGPGNATQVLALYIYRMGINRLDMGYASTISMVLFALIMIITVLQWKFVKSDWEY